MDSIADQAQITNLPEGTGFGAFVVYVLVAIALWKVFSKAGYPGILAIIPIVNVFVLVKVAGHSAWAGLLLFIPVVGFIYSIFLALRLGNAFGKGGVFSFFLLFLIPIVGYFILGYGSAQYRKP